MSNTARSSTLIEFNQEISKNKAVHVYFAQAIPLVTYIDESCLYLKEKKCRICEAVCKNKAIDFNQEPEKEEINVGAIILVSRPRALRSQGESRISLRRVSERGHQHGL